MDKEQIVRIVCNIMDISRAQLFGKTRIQKIVRARHLSFYLIRDFSHISSSFQAIYFDLDHTTVGHGIQRCEHLLERSEEMRQWYMQALHLIAQSKRKVA